MPVAYKVDERPVTLLHEESLVWPATIHGGTDFSLMLVGDWGAYSNEQLTAFFRDSIEAGMRLMCVWGNGCERVEDACDSVAIEDEIGARKYVGSNPDDVILTTRHAGDTLKDALFFFCFSIWPSTGFDSAAYTRYILVIDSEKSRDEVESYLRTPKLLS